MCHSQVSRARLSVSSKCSVSCFLARLTRLAWGRTAWLQAPATFSLNFDCATWPLFWSCLPLTCRAIRGLESFNTIRTLEFKHSYTASFPLLISICMAYEYAILCYPYSLLLHLRGNEACRLRSSRPRYPFRDTQARTASGTTCEQPRTDW